MRSLFQADEGTFLPGLLLHHLLSLHTQAVHLPSCQPLRSAQPYLHSQQSGLQINKKILQINRTKFTNAQVTSTKIVRKKIYHLLIFVIDSHRLTTTTRRLRLIGGSLQSFRLGPCRCLCQLQQLPSRSCSCRQWLGPTAPPMGSCSTASIQQGHLSSHRGWGPTSSISRIKV